METKMQKQDGSVSGLRNPHQIKWLVLGLGVVALGGCATMKSNKVNSAATPTMAEREGIAYFLPRARLNIKATLGGGGGGEETDKSASQINNVVNVVVNSGTKEETKKEDGASGGAGAGGAKDEQKPVYKIAIKEVYEPDPAQMFLLRPQFNGLSSDTYRVVVNNGLLTTINSTNADKTGEVLIDLAKIGAESFKLAAGFPSGAGLPRMVVKADGKPPKEFDLTFDPTNTNELAGASNLLQSAGLTLKLQNATPGNYTNGWQEITNLPGKAVQSFDGFFYRPTLPYTVSLSNTDGSEIRKTVFLPNEAPIVSFSPQRSPMVERVTAVTLENGILKEVYVSKPSSISAVVKVPLSILQSVAALPTELIQLKINYSTADKNLATAQKAELESLQALLEAQRNYLNAQTNNASGTK